MLKYISGVWIALGIVVAFVMPAARNLQTTPIAFFHVPMAVSMLLCFIVAAVYGGLWLKNKSVKADALSLAFAETGFLAGIITMLTGMIFSYTNWGAFWSYDPQQVGVLATLLTYGALFALREAVDDDRKKRNLWAVYSIVGAFVAVFGSYVFRQLLPSLHPQNTLFKSDALFKTALWFNVFGYFFFLVLVAQIRARLEIASSRLRELSWG